MTSHIARWTSLSLIPICLSLATEASAQEAFATGSAGSASAPAAAAAPIPDIVRLKNGSMLRGTITELIVGDHVDIRLISGESRRLPMQDVEYAGAAQVPAPAAATPPGPLPAPSKQAPGADPTGAQQEGVRVHIVANMPNVGLEKRTMQTAITGYVFGSNGGAFTGNANSYSSVCTAPCDVTLPVGTNHLALSYGGRAPIDVPVTVAGPSRLDAEYTSMQGVRIAGFVTFGATFVTGVSLFIIGMTQKSTDCSFSNYGGGSSSWPNCSEMSDPNGTLIGIGTGIALVGGLTGVIMALIRDTAQINVIPQPATGKLQILPVVTPRSERSVAGNHAFDGAGLTLRYQL